MKSAGGKFILPPSSFILRFALVSVGGSVRRSRQQNTRRARRTSGARDDSTTRRGRAAGTGATVGWEPGQVRKEAAITSTFRVPPAPRPLPAASVILRFEGFAFEGLRVG